MPHLRAHHHHAYLNTSNMLHLQDLLPAILPTTLIPLLSAKNLLHLRMIPGWDQTILCGLHHPSPPYSLHLQSLRLAMRHLMMPLVLTCGVATTLSFNPPHILLKLFTAFCLLICALLSRRIQPKSHNISPPSDVPTSVRHPSSQIPSYCPIFLYTRPTPSLLS